MSNGADIGFGIFLKTDTGNNVKQKVEEMQVCVANERVNSHMVPEDGSWTAEAAGVCE